MVERVHRWIYNRAPAYRALMRVLKRFTLPGFQGVRIYVVLSFFFRGFKSEDINLRTSAISYNFLMAMFPATIFFFTLIAYLPIKNMEEQILSFISGIMPHTAYKAIESTLTDILKRRQGGLLSLGFLMALYFSTAGINALISAFNKYTHFVEQRKAWRQQLASLWLTLYSAVLIIITIIVLTVGNVALGFLNKNGILGDSVEYYLLHFVKWAVTVMFIYCLISGLFHYGPSRKRKWPFFSAGSTLATILSLATTYGFSAYVNNFNSYNKLYGSIGTLIVVILLIYINCMVLLIGFELNVSIDHALRHKITTDHITPKNLENTFKEERS